MAKRFFDVFPSLQVEGDMKNLLTETEVTKVGITICWRTITACKCEVP